MTGYGSSYGGYGYGHNGGPPLWTPENAETSALLAVLTTPLTEPQAMWVDALIGNLKEDGNWTFLDAFFCHAAFTEEMAKVNWKNPAHTSTWVNSPTFAAKGGVTGNGSTQYINYNWNPTTAGSPQFTQNSASMFVWCGTDTTSSTEYDIGTSTRHSINAHVGSNQARFYPNQGSAATIAIPANTAVGLSAWTRRAADATEFYKNEASIGTASTAAGVLFNGNLFGLATNNVGSPGNPVFFTTRQSRIAGWGSQRSTAQMLALYNRINAALTALSSL